MPARQSGLTLPELLTTLAVVAILAAIAVPSYQALVQTNAQAAAHNTLVSSLNLARAEAQRRRQIVYVSPVGGQWQSGWNVWVDENRDGGFTAGTDTLIKRYTSSGPQVTVSGAPIIGFGPDGQLLQASGTTLQLRTAHSAEGINITLSRSGQFIRKVVNP